MALVFPSWRAANLWNRGVLPNAKMKPTRLSDYTYAVNEDTLTDPAFSLERPTLREGVVTADNTLTLADDSRAHHFFWIEVDGQVCYLAANDTDYALSMPADNVYRFEVRQNDYSPTASDRLGNRRRSELISNQDQFDSGDTVWVSFSFFIPTDTAASFDTEIPNYSPNRDGATIFQWHAPAGVSGGPWFNIELNNGNLEVVTRSSVTGNAVPVIRYSDTRPTDGYLHDVVMEATLGESGQVSVWLDGTQIVDSPTIPVGHYDSSSVIGYPQFGIYQNNFDDPSVIYHANVEWGTDDLSDRVDNPLTVSVAGIEREA